MNSANDCMMLSGSGFRNYSFNIGLSGVGGIYIFPRMREMAQTKFTTQVTYLEYVKL
jgi:hypothetical protein